MTAALVVLALQEPTISDVIATLDGKIELLSELPPSLEMGREYTLDLRITNTGGRPLPGIPAAEILSGKPTLFVGWGFSRTADGAFGFLGAVQIESPLAPGESRQMKLAVTPTDPALTVFRARLWVSRYEPAGLVGAGVGPTIAREIELPIRFRIVSGTVLLAVLAIGNAIAFGQRGTRALLRRRSAKRA